MKEQLEAVIAKSNQIIEKIENVSMGTEQAQIINKSCSNIIRACTVLIQLRQEEVLPVETESN